MAFLNPNVVASTATDSVKTNTGSGTGVDLNKDNDQFASTLRKQMQQNASESTASTNQTTEDNPASGQTASQANTGNQAAAVQSAQAGKKADSGKQEAQDANADNNPAASGAATPSKTTKQATQANIEPTSEPKKVATVNADSMNPADLTGVLPPWMQGMLAMRPNTTDAAGSQSSAETDVRMNQPQTIAKNAVVPTGLPAGDSATLEDIPQKNADAAPLPKQALLATTTEGAIPLDARTDMAPAKAGTDFKQVLSEVSGNGQDNSALTPTSPNDKLAMMTTVNAAANAATLKSMDVDKKIAGNNADLTADNTVSATTSLGQMQMTNLANSTVSNSPLATQMMTQVSTPFGTDRWQNAINQHVMNMVGSGDDVASLTLSPPDLGPIQVVLKVDNQSVDASFISDNTMVRQALEDGMQNLRERMQSQGLELGQTFIGNGQQAQQHFGQQTGQNSHSGNTGIESVATTTQPEAISTTKTLMGLVDTFV